VHTILSYWLMIAVFSHTVTRWNDRKYHDRMYRESVLVLFVVDPLSQHIPGKTEESARHFSQNRVYRGSRF